MCLFVVAVLVGTQGEIAFLAKQSEEERKKVEGREVEEKRQQRSKAIHRGSFPVPATAHTHTHTLSLSLSLAVLPTFSISVILCLCLLSLPLVVLFSLPPLSFCVCVTAFATV